VNGWILGYVVGVIIVVVVVAVLLLMIVGARHTAEKAEAILDGLNEAREGTAPLRELWVTAHSTERILAAATAARTRLTPGGSE
jgi:heme/copper-type cytochrome/quinol oxidase subunit 2